MTTPGLFHTNTQGGIHRRLITNDRIDHNQWMRTCAEGGIVGECRTCGGYLHPQRPTDRESHGLRQAYR